jgi:hypothetical protein
MAETYTLKEMLARAEAHQDEGGGGGGDFLQSSLLPEGTLKNGTYKVRVKKVKVIASNHFGLPGFGMVLEFLESDHKGEAMWFDAELTGLDFSNKRTISNLRALGISDNLINEMDTQGELIATLLTGKECKIKVIFKPNKAKPQFPYRNHVIEPTTLEIPDVPEDDDEDDDY